MKNYAQFAEDAANSGYYSNLKEWGFIQPTGAKVRGVQSADGHDEMARSLGKKDAEDLISRGAVKYSVANDGSSTFDFVDSLNNRKAVVEFLKSNPFAKKDVVINVRFGKSPKPHIINSINPEKAVERLQDVHLDEQYQIPNVDGVLDWGFLEPNGDVTDHGSATCLDSLAKLYKFKGVNDAVDKGLCAFIIRPNGSLLAILNHNTVMYHQLAIMIEASPYIKSNIEVHVYSNKAFLRKIKFTNSKQASNGLEELSEKE